jgi:hypothetical protein
MEHVFRGAVLGEPGGVKEGSGDWHLFSWRPPWETWERVHTPGAYVWKKVLGWVSLPVGEPGLVTKFILRYIFILGVG